MRPHPETVRVSAKIPQIFCQHVLDGGLSAILALHKIAPPDHQQFYCTITGPLWDD